MEINEEEEEDMDITEYRGERKVGITNLVSKQVDLDLQTRVSGFFL